MRSVRCVVALCLAFVFSDDTGATPPSQAFATDAARAELSAARSLKCEFPWFASADWDRDAPVLKSSKQQFGFHIDGIDRAKNAARLIGNAGAEDLIVLGNFDATAFIEQTPAGYLNVTTVYGWKDTGGRFKAVHSRHVAIGGPAPSQNYGYCQAWQ